MIETYSHGPNRASGDFCLAWRHRILHRTESHKSLREFDESRRPAEDSVLRASTGSLPQDGAQGRCPCFLLLAPRERAPPGLRTPPARSLAASERTPSARPLGSGAGDTTSRLLYRAGPHRPRKPAKPSSPPTRNGQFAQNGASRFPAVARLKEATPADGVGSFSVGRSRLTTTSTFSASMPRAIKSSAPE